VTMTEGSDLQPLEKGVVRIGNMDIIVVHVNLTNFQIVGRLVMGLWRSVEKITS
jgi:hypothetical protein